MTLDGLAVACLTDELHERLIGHRVQHVHHCGQDALALECYGTGRRSWLVICTQPAHPAVYLSGSRPPRPADEVTPLLLRLRKLVDGAVIAEVSSPPLERIVRIDLDGRTDDGPHRVSLIVEILGPGSVTILLDSCGTILESSRRAARIGTGTSARAIAPRATYIPPARPDRLDPRLLDGAALQEALRLMGPATPLVDAVVRCVSACSPQLAREVIAAARGHRPGAPALAIEHLDAATVDGIADALRDAWSRATARRWSPHLFLPEASDVDRAAFAPFPLVTVDGALPVATISEAIGAWHDGVLSGQVWAAEATASKALRQAVNDRLDKARARQYSLARALSDHSDASRLRAAGDWLLAYPERVPAGSTSILIDPSEVGLPGAPATVTLDPALGAVGNAQRVFKRYQKARAAAREVPPLLEAAAQERSYLEEALVHLDLARSADDVRSLREELAAGGYVSPGRREPKRGTRAPNRQPARGGTVGAKGVRPDGIDRIAINGFEVLVGRSGRGNDAALSSARGPDDLWMHARGVGGAHVIVRAAGRAVPEDVVRLAASLAAGRSASRGAQTVPVDVTARSNVTKVAGGPPGLVTYRNERTIQVTPAVGLGEGRPNPARSPGTQSR
jgi:predicted ribosome quality control (RQC) complex YloA/Tae2 family protein